MSVMSCYINSNKFIFIPRSMCLLSGVSLTANESALRLLLLCEELKPSCTSGMSNVCGGGVTLSRLVSRQNSNSSGNSKHGLSIFFSFSFSTFFLLCAATGFLTGACGTVRKAFGSKCCLSLCTFCTFKSSYYATSASCK